MAGLDPVDPDMQRFLRALRALGYVDGRNLVVEPRSAEGNPDRYPVIMAELIRLRVDVIVVVGNRMAQAAKEATSTIPIVMATPGNPVEAGLVASLAAQVGTSGQRPSRMSGGRWSGASPRRPRRPSCLEASENGFDHVSCSLAILNERGVLLTVLA